MVHDVIYLRSFTRRGSKGHCVRAAKEVASVGYRAWSDWSAVEGWMRHQISRWGGHAHAPEVPGTTVTGYSLMWVARTAADVGEGLKRKTAAVYAHEMREDGG